MERKAFCQSPDPAIPAIIYLMTIQLLLASQSPRRRQLIQLLNYPVQVITADVDERSITHPNPATNVVQTAELKAHTIAKTLNLQIPSSIMIAADTTVALNGRMLGKPADEAEAWQMLIDLRDQVHQVHTGLFLIDLRTGQEISGVNTAVVTMRSYTNEEIAAYIATNDPMDKAGAYAVQHPVFRPVAHIEGCYLCVVGLPVCYLIQLLNQLDMPVLADETVVWQAHQGYTCPVFNHSFS